MRVHMQSARSPLVSVRLFSSHTANKGKQPIRFGMQQRPSGSGGSRYSLGVLLGLLIPVLSAGLAWHRTVQNRHALEEGRVPAIAVNPGGAVYNQVKREQGYLVANVFYAAPVTIVNKATGDVSTRQMLESGEGFWLWLTVHLEPVGREKRSEDYDRLEKKQNQLKVREHVKTSRLIDTLNQAFTFDHDPTFQEWDMRWRTLADELEKGPWQKTVLLEGDAYRLTIKEVGLGQSSSLVTDDWLFDTDFEP